MTTPTLARCLMIQGTASHVGKSVLVTALCRILANQGVAVAPFKAQNIALNSYVTREGGEMGRAQVLQAQAARVEPHTDMNPILLKPTSDQRCQLILYGKVWGELGAWDYHKSKERFFPRVVEALERLRRAYQVVIIEGAGSPAEINLKSEDITNMRIARTADAPVLLVGDIDRGGVFASLLGTVELLESWERDLVAGFIINKFRGDPTLLGNGPSLLEEKTGIPLLGVVPYIHDLGLEEEDSVALEERRRWAGGHGDKGKIEIAVIHLPHISNYTDFDPLAQEPGINLRYVKYPEEIGTPDALIVPGTKSTVEDLRHLRATGMDDIIVQLAGHGMPLIGICGGYQMLGREILDPEGVESEEECCPCLGLLPMVTVMRKEKTTHQIKAVVRRPIPMLGLGPSSPPLEGYEIHMGDTISSEESPLLIVERSGEKIEVEEGLAHPVLNVFGCYIHGIFENFVVREGFLRFLAARKGIHPHAWGGDWQRWRDLRLDHLAEVARHSLDMSFIYKLLGLA